MRYQELNEYLQFDTDDEIDKEINDIVELIHRDCQPYLSEVRKSKCILVRGINPDGKPLGFCIQNIQMKRGESFTRVDRNNMLSSLMSNDGFKATRSNSTFCFSTMFGSFDTFYTNADNFGIPFAIFPTGHFDMTWMEPVNDEHDLGDNTWFREGMDILRYKFGVDYDDPSWSDQRVVEAFWDEYKDNFHNDVNLKAAANHETEVMISGSTFHAVNVHYFKRVIEGLL